MHWGDYLVIYGVGLIFCVYGLYEIHREVWHSKKLYSRYWAICGWATLSLIWILYRHRDLFLN